MNDDNYEIDKWLKIWYTINTLFKCTDVSVEKKLHAY